MRLGISPAIVPTRAPAVEEEEEEEATAAGVVVVTPAEEVEVAAAARSATSVARSATLRATATRMAAAMAEGVIPAVADMAAEEVMVVEAAAKPATPVVVTGTCPETVRKAKNVTTVSTTSSNRNLNLNRANGNIQAARWDI